MSKRITLNVALALIATWLLTSQVCFSWGAKAPLPCCGDESQALRPGVALNPLSAPPTCQVCTVPLEPNEKFAQCKKGHVVDEECLKSQLGATHIGSKEEAERIKKDGLRCYGNSSKCQEGISFIDIQRILAGTSELTDFNRKLDAACRPDVVGSGAAAPAQATPENPQEKRAREFRDHIAEAFNLCCPDCKALLAPIEGCNAAYCECHSTFCFLCLNKQENPRVAHQHVLTHSGDYWEHRDGHTGQVPGVGQKYTEVHRYEVMEKNHTTQKMEKKIREIPFTYLDRYHWLLVRKKMQSIFEREKDPEVIRHALVRLMPMLKENKMWPIPFGKNTPDWINEVMADASIDERNKKVLFQNELIHQLDLSKNSRSQVIKSQANARAEVLKASLVSLNAPVLASLDVGQAPHARAENINPVLDAADLARLPPGFIALGPENVYRIRDPRAPNQELTWSHVAPNPPGQPGRTYEEAIEFCRNLGGGARLPTKEEYEALIRAMSPGGRYNPDLLPDMRGRWFWSSGPNGFDDAWKFYGNLGNVSIGYRSVRIHVRCVVAL
jgi:hypothetical protein